MLRKVFGWVVVWVDGVFLMEDLAKSGKPPSLAFIGMQPGRSVTEEVSQFSTI